MAKVMEGSAKRANIAPPSRFRPQTWAVMSTASAWLAAPLAGGVLILLGPIMGLLTLIIVVSFYFISQEQVPKPIFPKKEGEPCINFGTDEYGLPIMLPIATLVRHCLLIGTTGSGKTTTIRTIAESIMKLGGGFCFVDGKADVTDTYAVLYEIVQNTDREEDLLVLNFLNPQQSHSFNFLIYGDADFLAEVMTGFMKDAQGDNAYWQEKGKVLMKVILSCLVYKRDHADKFDGFILTVEEIRRCFDFNKLLELAQDDRLPMYDEKNLPVKQKLIFYLNELGPWKEIVEAQGGRPPASAQEIHRQHGFYVQQWGAPFELLTGVFSPIFNVAVSDVDIVDVVRNSRVLVVLLPSLAYSLSTLRALGRVILSTFKIALTTGLGKDIVGDLREISEQVKRNRPSVPFVLIPDEYGSYAVEGFDTVLAQARSLGMGVMISVQEIASLIKASEADAKRLIGNTNIKIIMKIECPDTAKFVAERAGEEYYLMANAQGNQSMGGMVQTVGNFEGGFQYQKAGRLDPRDLTSLDIGEGYILFGDEVRKFKTRYIPSKDSVKEMKLMRFMDRATMYLRKKAGDMAQKAADRIDTTMVDVYAMMEKYKIGTAYEAIYKRFLKQRYKYLLAMGIAADYNGVAVMEDMHLNKFITEDEYGEMKIVVLQRAKFEELIEDEWKQLEGKTDFYNEILKPSEGANEFLKQSLARVYAIKNNTASVPQKDREEVAVV